ncbi:MAG TPA: sigma-70 family RNA polymerase sigma factor [Bryobacteraceae bacterium]|nr:sigma-70 family RNA polymerase sigma factor [Bryobacteraceae bacterium]
MNVQSEAAAESKVSGSEFDLEAMFRAQYARVARVIGRVVRDPARAEELAVEVFLKVWRNRRAQGEITEAWLYRAAVRVGLDELRRETRRTRYESLFRFARKPPTPEELHSAKEEQKRVRAVLSAIAPRQAELLILRSEGLSYDKLATALDVNAASIGTFLSRAQQAFRKEFIKRYGEE